MPHQSRYLIRQCTAADCRFRYPSFTTTLATGENCPKCGSPTIVIELNNQEMTGNPRLAEYEGVRLSALLDNIRSSYNVGSMFRTADGAGLSHLYLAGTTATPDHPGVVKTALGAESCIEWSYHRNSVDLAQELIASGNQLWALEVGSEAVPLFEAIPTINNPQIVLIVGNEVTGVDPGLLPFCELKVWIPMQGFKRSLNVATAFGIAAYFLRFGYGIKLKQN